MKDKETLTIILEIFGLQEQPNFSKSHIYFKSMLLTQRIQSGWGLGGDFKFMNLLCILFVVVILNLSKSTFNCEFISIPNKWHLDTCFFFLFCMNDHSNYQCRAKESVSYLKKQTEIKPQMTLGWICIEDFLYIHKLLKLLWV